MQKAMKTRLFHTKRQPSWLFYCETENPPTHPVPNLHDGERNQYTPVIP
jgi:hypothetical protein